MLRRARQPTSPAGIAGTPKKKPAPKRGLKVLKEDVVGTYAADARIAGTAPEPSAGRRRREIRGTTGAL